MPATHYTTIGAVNAFVPQAPFSANSKPTDANVTLWIDDIAQEMDASLANVGYVVPVVSGAKALQLLDRICAYGVLGLAQAARDTGDRKSTRLNSSHIQKSRMPSSA